jgi:DNA-binding GntR family transcriptional regulator
MTDTALDQLIEKDIVFGVFAPGSRLIEDRLMRRYGASRHTIRAAFTALEGKHLVAREPNRGVEVVEMTPEVVDELYAVRMILETSAAATTPLPVRDEDLVRLNSLCEQHVAAYLDGDFHAVFKLNLLFHNHQFGLCGNATLVQTIEDFARRVQSIRAIKYGDQTHMARIIAQHREIVVAMEQCDRDRYVAAVRAHLPASAEEYRKIHALRHGKFA